MPRAQNSSRRSKFYRQIGTNGWRNSGYFTFSASSPALRRWISSQLPPETEEILSVGCGAGELENHLAAWRHRVVGVDLSYPMLRRASRAGLKFPVQADGLSLPFGSARFDCVMLCESVGYFPLDDVLKEVRRVLRSRGRLMITTYAPHLQVHAAYRKFRSDEIVPPVMAAGFRIDEQRFLNTKRNSVLDVPSADQSTLFYLISTRQD